MRRFAAAIGAFVVGACLAIALVAPAAATSSTTDITTDVTVGAGHTYPSGAWGFTDGCEIGIATGQEMRCSFEFNLPSFLNESKITGAVLKIARTGGTCAANDCPVHLYSYTGNGSADLGDVLQTGSEIATWTPTSSAVHQFNVLGQTQTHVTNGEYWAGFVLRWVSGDSATQDFDIAGGSRVTLSVTYIFHPVDITVSKDGTGTGTITSSIPGINCGSTCTGTFTYAEPLTLTATPTGFSQFVTWSGITCDEGNQTTSCTFIVPSVPDPIVATFTDLGPPITQPPSATPRPTPTTGTPHSPSPSAHVTQAPASHAPAATSAPSGEPTTGPSAAPTDLAVATFAPGETVGPTFAPTAPASQGGDLPIGPIILIVGIVLAIGVGVGTYLFVRQRQNMAPPGA